MAGDALLTTDQTDYTSMYTDDAAPKDVSPADKLYTEISGTLKPVAAPTPAAPPAASGVGQASTAQPGAGSQGLIDRLKPLGIKDLNSLKGKSDVELRKLSQDVVTYELRQQSLEKYFKKNPDGSWDFTTGPDGNPTGLGADGKQLPPAGHPAPGTKPAPKPAPKPVPKPAPRPTTKPRPRPAPKRPPVRKPPAKRPPAKRPPARKPPVRRPPARPTSTKSGSVAS